MVNTDSQKIKEILTRGVETIIEKKELIEGLLSGKKLRIKFGIDPTSSLIHLGNAIPLWKLRQFQDAGHKIVLIIGNFTARIGDPSDKTAMRQRLTREQVKENLKNYKNQIGKILNLKKTDFFYNASWLDKLNFCDVVGLAECFTADQMIQRKNFQNRYKSGSPISISEFFYPLMQGYDSVALRADVEIGGTDQTFNLLAGRIIQKQYNQKPQNILTLTLLEGTDGRKMSKSSGNIIALTDKPIDIFKKIMFMNDDLIIRYFNLCTFLPQKEIDKITQKSPHDAKIRLAEELVKIYYDEKIAVKTKEAFTK